MNIGKAIKTLRLKRRLSQQQLAAKLRITQGFLSLIEKNQREPGFKLISKIANVFEVPPQLIFLLASKDDKRLKKYSKQLTKVVDHLDNLLNALS